MSPLVALVAALIPVVPAPATAQRVDLERLVIDQAVMIEAPPEWSRCPELYQVAIENWPGARDVWAYLDLIFWREARCNPSAINRRSGTRGLMQITRGNLRRLGVSYADALDPATNIRTGYELAQEWVAVGRSPWRPWWLRGWRP